MMVDNLLARLRNAGLTVSRNGDQLVVVPRARLTDELRAAIREAKRELLDALTAAPAGDNPDPVVPDLDARIRSMAQRWGYSAAELAEALASAQSDPRGWLIWTERDEHDFGNCLTPADFAAQYARIRGLA